MTITRKQFQDRPAGRDGDGNNAKHAVELPEPMVTARGDFGDGLAELVSRKVAALARHAHEPVLGVRVEFDRRTDPANPVVARANVDFNGRQVHATAYGRTARDAMNLVITKLTRQMDDRPHAHRRGRR